MCSPRPKNVFFWGVQLVATFMSAWPGKNLTPCQEIWGCLALLTNRTFLSRQEMWSYLITAKYSQVISINSCCNSMNFSKTFSITSFPPPSLLRWWFHESVWTSVFILHTYNKFSASTKEGRLLFPLNGEVTIISSKILSCREQRVYGYLYLFLATCGLSSVSRNLVHFLAIRSYHLDLKKKAWSWELRK